MKKFVSLVLVLLMALSVSFAEDADEVATIKIACGEVEVANCSFSDTLPTFKAMEEKLGIKFEWDVVPSDYKTVMSTRLASKDNLPDLMLNPGLSLTMLANGGIAVPLNDLIDEYGPNIKAQLEANPAITAEMTAPDGTIYTIPGRFLSMEAYCTNPISFMIRYDWLEKCGVDAPTTIDEWHDVMAAFIEMDANGNGEADETPFCTNVGYMYAFSSAYGLDPMTNFGEVNGEIFYQWTSDAARDFFTTMATWYEEGLIAQDYLTDRNIDARHLEDQTGASYMWAVSNCAWQNENNTISHPDWRPIVPPKNVYTGEDGFVTVSAGNLNGSSFIVTNANGRAADVIKLVDFICSEEGCLILNMGIEGETFYFDEAGDPHYIPEFISGGNWYQNTKAYGIDPICVPHVSTAWLADATRSGFSDEMNAAAAALIPYIKVSMPSYSSTDEEELVMDAKYNDIKTYVNEMTHKFIIGTESLDNWDEYVAKVYEMGLEDVLAVKQAQYDRNN